MSFKQRIKQNLINIPGWRTNRKIVVFESDDWGMIRMASKTARERLAQKGHPVYRSVYNTYDALACNDDVEQLISVLSECKDSRGYPAKFTLNTLMANPDFQKIKESDYHQYFYQPSVQTLDQYPDSDRVFPLIKQGIKDNIFQPQFHGREHVQINNWLYQLRSGNCTFLDAFEENIFTLNPSQGFACRTECLDAMATYQNEDFSIIKTSLCEGLKLFENIWDFRSRSIIAPCYTWHHSLEAYMSSLGIKYIQGAQAQREPRIGKEKKKIRRHYLGQRNASDQCYLIRNVHFEQVENPDKDWVDSAMAQIRIAFRMKKPAVISTHRVNYIGRIEPINRERNLQFLKGLLKAIIKYYPAVEFMSTDELGDLMTKRSA
jgi:hypothetical protein